MNVCFKYTCTVYTLICYCFIRLETLYMGIPKKNIHDLMQVTIRWYIRQPTKALSPHGNELWMLGKHQSLASVGINLARRDHMWPLYLSRSISERIRKPCKNCDCYLLIVPDLLVGINLFLCYDYTVHSIIHRDSTIKNILVVPRWYRIQSVIKHTTWAKLQQNSSR